MLFPTARFNIDIDQAKQMYSCIPPDADPSKYWTVNLIETMDPITKK